MRLKSLQIQGFKTFPDKTKLSFEQGITSVVGPNGSGKSNISDAIRWVLGEQSPKSLRCSKMEDVVFNGTDKRKRQGYAEVTLNIDNSDRFLPFDGDEIAVTRRYYRSGESEYMINKAAVRLRDINELFMDTGLGRFLQKRGQTGDFRRSGGYFTLPLPQNRRREKAQEHRGKPTASARYRHGARGARRAAEKAVREGAEVSGAVRRKTRT